MKLLTVAFAWLLSKTCAEHQWGKVWAEFLKQIRVVKIPFTSYEHAILSRNKNVINFSTRPSPAHWWPLFIVIYKRKGKCFLTRLKKTFMNKSCNNVNILPDSFLHGKKISEDYFESFCPFSNREKTKVLNRLRFRLMKM